LKDGYFKTLCADIHTKTDEVLHTMMLVLCHLFSRKICREVEDAVTAETIRRSPSMVYLPPLPKRAAVLLREHNAKTLSIFKNYVKTFAQQHVRGEDRLLPLTNILVGGEEPIETDVARTNEPNGHAIQRTHSSPETRPSVTPFAFLPTLPVARARSAFVALSGHGDDFVNINDLCTSTRSGIFLESAVIPHLELHPDESRTPLNAYLLDFFIHGSIKPLEVANGIRRSDVWFDLNDFSLVLATIVTSLAGHLGLNKGDVDEEILETMGSGDQAENDGDEEMAETASISTSSSTQTAPSTTTSIAPSTNTSMSTASKKSKRVAEDWDEAEDAIVAQQKMDEENEVNAVNFGTDDQEYRKMMKVFYAFKKLKTEFDTKFRAIWA
jgi:ATP-dependent RNA helicase DDX60